MPPILHEITYGRSRLRAAPNSTATSSTNCDEPFNSRRRAADVAFVPAPLATADGYASEVPSAEPTTAATTEPVPKAPAVVDPRTGGLTALFQAAAEGNLLLDADGRIVFGGGVAHAFLGRSSDQMLQQLLLDLVPGDQRLHLESAIQRVRNGQSEPMFESRWINQRTGATSVVALQLAALSENGKLLGIAVKIYELATRQAAEAAARGDLGSSRVLAEASPLIVFQLNGRGQCTFLNGRWAEITGQQPTDAVGTGWLQAMPEQSRNAFRTVAATAHKEKRGWRHCFEILAANGQAVAVDGAAMPLIDASNATIGYFGTIALVSAALGAANATSMAAPASTSTSTVAPPPPPQPIERHALPKSTTIGGTWTPPPLREGFTDPSLLVDRKAPDADEPVEARVEPIEPGIDRVTGLANRPLFSQHVSATVSRMEADALTVSLSFVHLHGLADIRNNIGSRPANDYLFLLAKRLESTIRSIEIAGCIDGDVLGVLSINWLFKEDLPVVCGRLLAKLGEPLAGKDGQEITVPLRLGMAVATPGEPVEALFSRTWAAMEAAESSPDNYSIDLA